MPSTRRIQTPDVLSPSSYSRALIAACAPAVIAWMRQISIAFLDLLEAPRTPPRGLAISLKSHSSKPVGLRPPVYNYNIQR
jgi:hypothetical protein